MAKSVHAQHLKCCGRKALRVRVPLRAPIMILQDLYTIVQKGAKEPLAFWLSDFQKISRKVLPQLKEIGLTIAEKTTAKENLQQLIKLLEQERPNALALAKLLSYVASIFSAHPPTENRELINQYIQDCLAFQKIAQQEEFYEQKRAGLKKTMSLEQQQQYDKRLFNHEGMIYCLEFYLQLYKAIQDASTPEQKWHYVNSTEVNFGTGNLSGLKEDFKNDEVLQKFIYYILDDNIRDILTKKYFFAKILMLNSSSLEEIISTFKDFITVLLQAFEKVSINQLASFFFTPYGRQPLIKNIKL